jgi:multiple sugar transport system ATP-binding protein
MNFLRGTLQRDGGGWMLDATDLQLPLDGAPARLDAYLAKPVVVGIRPEDLKPTTAPAVLRAKLELMEPVGNEVFLNLDCHGTPLVARTPPQALPEPGSFVNLSYVPSALHVFDAQSGQRLDA